MENWEDVLAPCPIGVTPFVVVSARFNMGIDEAKDRLMEILREHGVPFVLLGNILESCRFAVIFEQVTRYGTSTSTINYAIIHIDPPRDRVKRAIEYVFAILKEAGFEIGMTVDEAVREYERVVKALTCS